MPKINIRNIDIDDLPEQKKEKFIKRKNREEQGQGKLKKQTKKTKPSSFKGNRHDE